MASNVFQVHHKSFLDKINLDTLAPKLYSKNLLTEVEYEAVTYIPHLPHDRKVKLVQYLQSKGKGSLPVIVECLRQETTHPPHAELADIIEDFQSDFQQCTITANSPALSTNSRLSVSESAHHLQTCVTSDTLGPRGSCNPPHSSHSVHGEVAEGAHAIQSCTVNLKTGCKRNTSSNSNDECDHVAPSRKRANCDVITQSTDTKTLKYQRPNPLPPTTEMPSSDTDLSQPNVVSSHDSRPQLPESLQTLAKTLKATYRDKKFFQKAAGPSVGNIQFINLALVQKQGVSEDEKEQDEFLKSTLHGAVDDIIKKKEEILLEDIFKYSSEGRKLVLVEGAPGVGKTMLAMKLCVDWANGKFLQEYDLVLLVQLRRFQASFEVTVEELVHIYLTKSETARQASDDLLKHHSNALLILEGWDELSPNLRKEMTFFFDIVQAYKLPEASVMVTSRPSVTASLYDYFDERHIEVLGFTRTEIEMYVKQHTSSPLFAGMVLDHFKQFPNLRALAHIPLTLAIICNLVRDRSTLPPTLTELYKRHICNTLHQNLKHQILLPCVRSIDELDEDSTKVIRSLSSLALNGFKEKMFVFSRENLLQVGLKETLSTEFDGYGLLSTIQVRTTAGHDCFYQFRHLSIQEYLAAFHVKELVSEERLQLLKDYRDDKQFQNVWKFLAGITQLREESLQELIISETNQANRAQLFLLHCLFEAHDQHICEVAATKVRYTINLSNITLNTTDLLCAAYVITGAGGEWEVNLRGANVGEDGLEVFKSHLLNHLQVPESERTEVKLKKLDLAHNRSTGNAVLHLTEMVGSELHIEYLDLASNKFGDRREMETLASALAGNHTVTNLHLSRCDLKIQAAISIGDMLKVNNTLNVIYLQFDIIGDVGIQYIVDALKKNHALKELTLTRTGLTIVGLQAIAEMMDVNKTLEVLRIDRNDLRLNECRVVANIIARNDNIAIIDISKNPIGDDGFEVVLDCLIRKPKSSLKKIVVFGCKITHESLSKLVDLFAVTETLHETHLGCNNIGDKGAELLCKALERNKSKSVKRLSLEQSGITEKGKKKLEYVRKSLGRDPKDLDFNFTPNAHLQKRREQKSWSA